MRAQSYYDMLLAPSHVCSSIHCPIHRYQLGSYYGNQKGDAGGGVVTDVTQHESVLSEEEEDLHFQVQLVLLIQRGYFMPWMRNTH